MPLQRTNAMTPYRKPTYRKKYNPKKYRDTRYKKKPIPHMLGNKIVTRLRYAIEEGVTITSTLGGYSELVYSLTNMYDPRVAIGGHQPRGFDQLMELFDHYLIIGAKAKIGFISTNEAATQQPATCFVAMVDDSAAISGRLAAVESRYSKQRYLTQDNREQTMVMNFSSKKFFARGKGLLNDKQLMGSIGSAPAENCFLHVGLQCHNTGATVVASILGYIDFICVLSEPKRPPVS